MTVKLLDPLPRRVRARLWLQRHVIDAPAIWLCGHHGWRLAIVWWKWIWRQW